MKDDNEILDFLEKNRECYDRFTFDLVMRFLLNNGFDNEDAKEIILTNCELSAITFQERIHNNYYKRILTEERFSDDLRHLIDTEIRRRQITKN